MTNGLKTKADVTVFAYFNILLHLYLMVTDSSLTWYCLGLGESKIEEKNSVVPSCQSDILFLFVK